MKMKGQTSLDFLMTYGWALLLIVIVVGALFALGVFNVGSFVGSRSTGFAQVGVIAWQVTSGTLSMRVQNHAGSDVNITSVSETYNGATVTNSTNLNIFVPNGQTSNQTIYIYGTGVTTGTYMVPISLTYEDSNHFNYTETGTLAGTGS